MQFHLAFSLKHNLEYFVNYITDQNAEYILNKIFHFSFLYTFRILMVPITLFTLIAILREQNRAGTYTKKDINKKEKFRTCFE